MRGGDEGGTGTSQRQYDSSAIKLDTMIQAASLSRIR